MTFLGFYLLGVFLTILLLSITLLSVSFYEYLWDLTKCITKKKFLMKHGIHQTMYIYFFALGSISWLGLIFVICLLLDFTSYTDIDEEK